MTLTLAWLNLFRAKVGMRSSSTARLSIQPAVAKSMICKEIKRTQNSGFVKDRRISS
jgi:hypothetical protein